METAFVKELHSSFAKIENLLCQGEETQITKLRWMVAWLLLAPDAFRAVLPNFPGRKRAIFRDECLKVNGATLISKDRSERLLL